MFWEQNYQAGQKVYARDQNGTWEPGTVADGFYPAPDMGVLVRLADGPVLVSDPGDIRPR